MLNQYLKKIDRNQKIISEFINAMRINDNCDLSDGEVTELIIISGYFELLLKRNKMNINLTESEKEKSEDMILRIEKIIIKK